MGHVPPSSSHHDYDSYDEVDTSEPDEFEFGDDEDGCFGIFIGALLSLLLFTLLGCVIAELSYYLWVALNV